MSKKVTPADLAAQLAKAKAKAAELREQVRTTEIEAAKRGIDLNKLPTKAEVKADKRLTKKALEAAAAEDAREAAEAERRTKPTSVRMAERVLGARAEQPTPAAGDTVPMYRGPLRSADRLAQRLEREGVLDEQADPSRDVLPRATFLQSSAEVVSRVQPRRSPISGQSRVVVPQHQRPRDLASMTRVWGSAPGQAGGLRPGDPRLERVQ